MMKKYLLFSSLILLSACTPPVAARENFAPTEAEAVEEAVAAVVSQTPNVEEEPTLDAVETLSVPSPRPTLSPDAWMEMPAIPDVSDTVRDIYERGQEMGNDPQVFSKVGDCQNVTSRFLGVFDHPDEFTLGAEYDYLQATIDYFSGSYSRDSLAVNGGNQPATVLTPLHADKNFCEPGESPFVCEIRVNNPSFVLISLEAWGNRPIEIYEGYLRQIIDHAIEEGVVPILATKADNLEGDHSVNRTIAKLAYEYDIPLWNFWKATQALSDGGLEDDGFHLTFSGDAGNQFDDPARMKYGWAQRNLTALQALDAVRRGLTE
jgi:hypothetical protein